MPVDHALLGDEVIWAVERLADTFTVGRGEHAPEQDKDKDPQSDTYSRECRR
jgi:hypothetical protein